MADAQEPKNAGSQSIIVKFSKAIGALIIAPVLATVIAYFILKKVDSPPVGTAITTSTQPSPAVATKEPVPPAHVASPPPPAVTPSAPPVQTVTAPSPVEVAPSAPGVPSIACGSNRVPDAAQLAGTWDQKVCTMMACAGRTDLGTMELSMLHEWGSLAAAYSEKACLVSTRASLADQETVNALYGAIGAIALPERDPQRTVCRHVKNALQDTIVARQQKLDEKSPALRRCPEAEATTIPDEVRTFAETYRLSLKIAQ